MPGSSDAKSFETGTWGQNSPGELAVETHFVLVQVNSGFAESQRVAGEGVGRFGLPGFVDFIRKAGTFHAPDAHQAPVGYGHFVNQEVFDGGFGLQFLLKRGHESVEAPVRFAVEDDRAGEHSAFYAGSGERAAGRI
jgi:hypothetical protein